MTPIQTTLQSWSISALWVSSLLTSVPVVVGMGANSVYAESVAPEIQVETQSTQAESAPPDLVALLEQMDESANAKRLKPFMKNFETSFTHDDGLNRRQLKQTVRSFWKQFDELTYKTTLESWEEISPGLYKTMTLTAISGQQQSGTPGSRTLTATVRSEQQVQNSKIVSQKVLEEKSQITSGTKPPTVRINLPTTVAVGEDYYFDVIVDEPLGDRILLGAAIEESVNPEGYLNPSKFEIQSLATGGLFKIGQAPKKPTDQWISALLIQDGGMYLMSQRISVINSPETALNKK